ncbi:Hypothetical protein Eab7_2711 [Exiguobacterium antarcticum B7]|nr:Hypothetical protein Eab7_2711 [Exiguobacterium antarcticum B7]
MKIMWFFLFLQRENVFSLGFEKGIEEKQEKRTEKANN